MCFLTLYVVLQFQPHIIKINIYIEDFQFNRLVSYANEDEEEEGDDLDRESDEHEADESKCLSIIFDMQYVEIRNKFLLL